MIRGASNLRSLNAIMGVGDIGEKAELEFENRFNDSAMKKRSKTPGIQKRRLASAYTAKRGMAARGESPNHAGTIISNHDSAENPENSYIDGGFQMTHAQTAYGSLVPGQLTNYNTLQRPHSASRNTQFKYRRILNLDECKIVFSILLKNNDLRKYVENEAEFKGHKCSLN